MNKFVYTIFGNFSGEKRVSFSKRGDIVEAARQEARREGTTLEGFAGITYAEDAEGNFWPARELEGEELFGVAVDYLNDVNYLFLVFGTDANGTSAFLKKATAYGVEESARFLLKYA
jgi:hypothetical protein